MKKITLLALAITTMILSGCATKNVAPSLIERNGIDIISNTSDTQMTFIKQHGNLERYCAARESDVADTSSSGISFGAGTIGDTANISDGSSQGALSLGGRDPAVLIVRELMYRACELTMNLNTNKDDTIDIYMKFMSIMKEIAIAQQGNGVSPLKENATPIVNIKTVNKPQSKQNKTNTSDDSSLDNTTTSDDDSSLSNSTKDSVLD